MKKIKIILAVIAIISLLYGYTDTVKYLIDARTDLELENNSDNTTLSVASSKEHIEK